MFTFGFCVEFLSEVWPVTPPDTPLDPCAVVNGGERSFSEPTVKRTLSFTPDAKVCPDMQT